MTLEKGASLDATTIARLRKEQDELLQTTERLPQSMVWLMRSATRPFKSMNRPTKSVMMCSRRSAPSRPSSET